ncbi:hypothetical protein GCM10007857_80740 [Bradyrhizobium iriomotense]|uniref:Uncharacterized protein n=1 Tax=Bradyrhizobium iriomotense TaxID=441950 RepID=A0ABQ6BAF0_9BRAD|nr:hypothetical protein GCM10007857_80740 [Bradyrhizobium iriomotense]
MRRLPRLQRLSSVPKLSVWRRLPMCRMCRGGMCRGIMRRLLRIVGPLPLVLGHGAFRWRVHKPIISLAGREKRAGQFLGLVTTRASAAI